MTASIENDAIERLGLRRIESDELSIERKGDPGEFSYEADGKPVNRKALRRIRDLAIPPAWQEVRIADDSAAHLQAVGRDDAGRLQYIYHSAWEDVRSETKRHRLLQLGRCLARIRATVQEELRGGNANRPLAAAIRLVDLLHLRAGHEGYAGEESGRGVATLLKRHLRLEVGTVRVRFRGKGGKLIDKSCADPALFAALEELRKIRGQRLFKIQSENSYRPVTASKLNEYLQATAGRPVSAKDFRTLHASSRAIELLAKADRDSPTAKRRAVAAAARQISEDLANTPSIVRKSYIHSSIIDAFESADPIGLRFHGRARHGLTPAESALFRFLEKRR